MQLSAVAALLGAVLGHARSPRPWSPPASRALREAVLTASGVLANFGGVPLAFAFVATLGNSGVVTRLCGPDRPRLEPVQLLGPGRRLPVLLGPADGAGRSSPRWTGCAPQWREAAQNNGATAWQYWRHVGLPVLAPSLLGGFVLLFGSAFAAYATAAAMVGSSVPLVTLQIADALSGNVLVGQENMALALSLDMIVIAGLVMAVYLPLQRRSARWLR